MKVKGLKDISLTLSSEAKIFKRGSHAFFSLNDQAPSTMRTHYRFEGEIYTGEFYMQMADFILDKTGITLEAPTGDLNSVIVSHTADFATLVKEFSDRVGKGMAQKSHRLSSSSYAQDSTSVSYNFTCVSSPAKNKRLLESGHSTFLSPDTRQALFGGMILRPE